MIDQVWAFLVAITLLTLFPGVDSLLVVRNSARGGVRDGVVTSTGICCGLFVHASLSAVGMSAILLHSAVAWQLLKLLGGGYLIWLGVLSLREACKGHAPRSTSGDSSTRVFRWSLSFREGFCCNLFNPKTLLFYMAFLPQFISPGRSAIAQSLLMAAIHFGIAMLYQSLLACSADRLSLLFRRMLWKRLGESLAGLLLFGFGLRILLERR